MSLVWFHAIHPHPERKKTEINACALKRDVNIDQIKSTEWTNRYLSRANTRKSWIVESVLWFNPSPECTQGYSDMLQLIIISQMHRWAMPLQNPRNISYHRVSTDKMSWNKFKFALESICGVLSLLQFSRTIVFYFFISRQITAWDN